MDAIKGCGVPSVRTTVQKTPSLIKEGVCGRDAISAGRLQKFGKTIASVVGHINFSYDL
jgi:hypothetical protein